MDPLSNLNEEDRWKSTILDEIFKALVSSPDLSRMLVYKGARVLRLRLQEILRASFDIDACLSSFAANVGDPVDVASLEKIKELAHRAISEYFESQDPVRYELQQSQIGNRRKIGPHPRGWNVYWLDLKIRDLAGEEVLSASAGQLRIDIAAPELISEKSISPLVVDGYAVNAITLERIAGEKLRAFLSCLPAYRRKIREKTQIARRVKDLYDLVRIARKRPMSDVGFWTIAGGEFILACQSRFIDCEGIASFCEEWGETKKAYAADKTLPNDVTIEDVEVIIDQLATFLVENNFIPYSIAFPDEGMDAGESAK